MDAGIPGALRPAALFVATLFLLLPPPAATQEVPSAEEEPQEDEGPEDRRGLLPSVDFYFPEGEMDFRLNGLVRNTFYEGQVRYNFVEGDISAFLRYRYYGFARTYLIGVFDEVEFEAIEKRDNDFERVRGGLLLVQWPHNYNNRSFVVFEVDRITSNKEEFRFSTNRTNTFVKVGHQLGTPNDLRSNAIVGETRAKIDQLFTAHRKIGPFGAGLSGAVTYGFDAGGGDFNYLRAELEGLKRFEHKGGRFLIGRIHGGTFLYKEEVRPEAEPVERYAVPRTEFFRLDGRDNLRGIDQRLRGTEELHITFEYFLPWFLDQDHRALGLQWKNWYWILYSGVGTIGFDRSVYTDLDSYIPDLGLGFESSLRLRNYTFFLSAIVANALRDEGGLETFVSIKSYH